MNDDLMARFEQLRECDRRAAPAWRPLPLDAPASDTRRMRIPPALAVAAVFALCAASLLLRPGHQRLADLPPLIELEPQEFLVTSEVPSTDCLLPSHLTIRMP